MTPEGMKLLMRRRLEKTMEELFPDSNISQFKQLQNLISTDEASELEFKNSDHKVISAINTLAKRLDESLDLDEIIDPSIKTAIIMQLTYLIEFASSGQIHMIAPPPPHVPGDSGNAGGYSGITINGTSDSYPEFFTMPLDLNVTSNSSIFDTII